MERGANDLTVIGVVLLLEAVLVIFIVLHHFGEITDHYATTLANADYQLSTLLLLVVRTAAYGTIVSAILVIFVRFSGVCFDQATRFRKRTHSAHVLNVVLSEYDEKIKAGEVTLENALEVFKAWNLNVESAFTSMRTLRPKQETVSAGAAPSQGPNFYYGAPVIPAAPAKVD